MHQYFGGIFGNGSGGNQLSLITHKQGEEEEDRVRKQRGSERGSSLGSGHLWAAMVTRRTGNRGSSVTLPSGEQQGQKERGRLRGLHTRGSTFTRHRGKEWGRGERQHEREQQE